MMLRPVVRTLSFFGKWSAEVLQQPGLLLSLIVGPFLILLAFGVGVRVTEPQPKLAAVAGETWRDGQGPDVEMGELFEFEAVFQDVPPAEQMLREEKVDAVLVLPPMPEGRPAGDEPAEITVLTNEIDPQRNAFLYTHMANAVSGLNHQAARHNIESAQASTKQLEGTIDRSMAMIQQARAMPGASTEELDAIERDLTASAEELEEFNGTPSWVIATPFRLEHRNVAAVVPDNTAYYGPAVLVLLLQHLAITLGALSMAHIRLLGILELMRVSPTKPTEVVVGHYLSYGAMAAVVGVAMTLLLVYILGVPMLGSAWGIAAVLTLLTLSSLGVGFVIALVSSSEQQAAQITMLVLLASIFFSGLLFSLERVLWPAQAISLILPATYGIASVQDSMLRGDIVATLDLIALGSMTLVFLAVAIVLLKREWRPA